MASEVESPAHPPVMTDVARLARVSHQTVSRVLNQPQGVRPATRERVLAAIDALGYRPNSAARALVTGRSLTIGVVSYGGTLYGPASSIDSIEKAAAEAGYFVSIAAIHDLGHRALGKAVDRLRAQAVDGIMAVTPFPLSLPENIPAVMLHGGDPKSRMPSVSVDQELGARLATEHLLGLGHRSVWHVAGHEKWSEAHRRIAGWKAALADAAADAPPPLQGDWSAQSGYEAGLRLAREPAATAIFVANDHMALGVLRALEEAGRRVPGDVCVVGFDNIPEAGFLTPSLSTVRQDFPEVGRRSVALILDQIDKGAREPISVSVEPELIVRESSSPGDSPATSSPGNSPATSSPEDAPTTSRGSR
ncbi:MAG: LacI family DNA-binding transcriptional regulator [Streptosporangiaceae bacterium]